MTHQLEELDRKLYELMDSFLVESKNQHDEYRSIDQLNRDRHLFVSNAKQLIAQHDTELLAEVEEKLLSYRGAYIAAGGKRVDNMVHHSVIKEVIEQYRVSPTIQKTNPVSENGDSETSEQYQHKPSKDNETA